MLSTIGAFVLGFSALALLWNMIWSRRHGRVAGDNPWRAWTLEWATTSPPPPHNFDRLPAVRGRRPLWDLAHPEQRDEPNAPIVTVAPPTIDKNKVAMLLLIATEATFFLTLILGYTYYSVFSPTGGSHGALDVPKTAVFTVCLLSSSGTLWLAERALAKGSLGGFRAWLWATIALGAVFIMGQGREYWHLFETGVTINSSLFATAFFTLTGFHGLHVCVGLIGLLILLRLAKLGEFRHSDKAVKNIGLYWHFVDAVWIAVFSVVYLRTL
jgi:heme/copper-type cytochrome/quinol oxidase subunit 3